MRIGLVVAEFNYEITKAMEERAREHANFLGCDIARVLRVPGCYDMPLAVKKLLENDEIDGVVALGAVIEGGTQHDEIVAQHAARKLIDLSVASGKPVGLGIIGPGATRLQAQERIDGYAKRAVEAVVKLQKMLEE